MTDHLKAIVKLFETFRYKHDLHATFSDWCECAAISISNAADLSHRDKREARYLEIARKYKRSELETFTHIFGELTLAMEQAPRDVLGQVFHALELHNTARGQFFTPYPLCQMMARMLIGSPDELARTINRRGFIVAQEPAVGAGAMIIALAEAMKEAGHNYQQCLHVTAVDIDRRAVHMAYIQFSLMHIPAVVIEGDSLAMKFREEWVTLAHVIGGWRWKLAGVDRVGRAEKGDHPRSMLEQTEAVAVKTTATRTGSSVPQIGTNGQLRLF
ncbi:N-6 DNA methylase [Ensifer sp. SL37]|uniref:N-6 DNA methylase n=1 Tax=Ensifer sp. SL37 TaxID=2995137 RepID=UPI002275DC85|nr:N-6 DNA methylase [Ensifer sp. SL37]MCY1740975.1 N-6 DNA methylase [Ensifer sp. SL37]